MNLFEYVQSRFLLTQIAINRKQTTQHGENHAMLGWMWVLLKISTVFRFLLFPFEYVAVLVHLSGPMKRPFQIATDEAIRLRTAQEEAAKIAAEVTKSGAAKRD